MTVHSVAHVRNTRDNNVGKLAFNLLPLKLGHIKRSPPTSANKRSRRRSPTRPC